MKFNKSFEILEDGSVIGLGLIEIRAITIGHKLCRSRLSDD